MKGIRFYNGKHSYYDMDAVLSVRVVGFPATKTVEESVPYSSTTYDFTELYGAAAYGERLLRYTFTLMDENRLLLQEKLNTLVNWLYAPAGKIPLYDDQEKGYHYMAKCISVSDPEFGGCSVAVTATFKASPFRIPDNPAKTYTGKYPDLNGDGVADAADAAILLDAAAKLGAGEESGLTAEQEVLADINQDGVIDASDAVLLTEFAALVGSGTYENTPSGWNAYMEGQNAKNQGVI